MTEPLTDLDPLAAACDYLAPNANAFWTWSDDGEVLTWPNGRTIVFREELRTIIEWLTPSGLPPLGALLLLLAACRDGWGERSSDEAIVPAIFGETRDDPLLRIPTDLHDALLGLDAVAKLPAEQRRGVAAKATLAESVFEANRRVPPAVGRAVASLLTGTLDVDMFTAVGPTRPLAGVIEALGELRRGFSRLHPDSLKLRSRTGLDQLVVAAKSQLMPDVSLRDFVTDLIGDEELRGLGRLARELMAAVQLPRAISEPDDLPLGGVSDVTNRGPLDRLLVSELAHDDVTLATRVALNEALYLRRESPPKTPPADRLLLIDCGIRLWGVPRVFAAAAALALAATSDRRANVRVFRATRHGMAAGDLATREGLIAHLEVLETAPHPAVALRPFLARLVEAPRADAVLITHEDALTDGDFRRELDAHDQPLYVATVARNGRFRLSFVSRRGVRSVREAAFDLEKLLAPAQQPVAPLLRPNAGTDLPAIFAASPFPLFLPDTIDLGAATHHAKHGAVTVSKDGRLLHWPMAGQGSRQLSASVPKGKVWIVSVNETGVVRLVVGGGEHGPLWLVRASLGGSGSIVDEISNHTESPRGVVENRQVLFVVYNRHVETARCGDETRAWIELPARISWRGGRFFSDGEAWHALDFDGMAPRLERVSLPPKLAGQDILCMFDRIGLDGPWVITKTTNLVCTVTGATTPLDSLVTPLVPAVVVSRDGHRVAFFAARAENRAVGSRLAVVQLPNESATAFRVRSVKAKNLGMAVEPEMARHVRSPVLRRHARSAGVWDHGLLSLTIEGRRQVQLELDQQGTLRWSSTSRGTGQRAAVAFQPVESPEGTRTELAVAAWPDGTRIWLDGRGLLHLRSSDPRQPEVTLVLVCDKPVAGWTSDGKVWGTPYFTGLERASRAPDDVVRFLQTISAKLRCST
jgi:hypothetical protein